VPALLDQRDDPVGVLGDVTRSKQRVHVGARSLDAVHERLGVLPQQTEVAGHTVTLVLVEALSGLPGQRVEDRRGRQRPGGRRSAGVAGAAGRSGT
jgi:hypothetical protein